jgi:hypothetical protein
MERAFYGATIERMKTIVALLEDQQLTDCGGVTLRAHRLVSLSPRSNIFAR